MHHKPCLLGHVSAEQAQPKEEKRPSDKRTGSDRVSPPGPRGRVAVRGPVAAGSLRCCGAWREPLTEERRILVFCTAQPGFGISSGSRYPRSQKKKKKPDRVNSAAADETIERSLSIKKEKGAGGGDLFYAGLDTICAPNHHADVVKLT